MPAHDSPVANEARPVASPGNPAPGSGSSAPAQAAAAVELPPNTRIAPTRTAPTGTAPAPGGLTPGGLTPGGLTPGGPPLTGPTPASAIRGWDCATDPDDGTADGPHKDPARRPGRPRSEKAEQAILDATIEAIGERGIDGLSCEDVAARAGVGKATLYRRWPGKEDLLIAAFGAMRRPMPEPKGESVRDDLIALLQVIAADADDPRHAQQFALLLGAGERYPRLVAGYKERVIEPRRELVREVLRRGIATGELRPGTNVEVAMLLLSGCVMARGKHDATPAEPGFVESAVDELLEGITSR